MRKIWDIPGGVHPAENKTQSNHSPIASIELPVELILPVSQHIGASASPCVSIGEQVKKGQIIAEAIGLISVPVHAPTSATVTAIESRPIPHASGLSALCIVLQPDGKDEWTHKNIIDDFRAQSSGNLIEHIRQHGIAGMGGAGFPTAVKLAPRSGHIDTLILNGTECEPYITADDMLMRERANNIIRGIDILAHILGHPKHVLIGIEDNKPEAIASMRESTVDTPYEVVSFPTKYPSGGEKQLIQILTGKEVPNGKLPADIGIVLQNIGTAEAIYRAVCKGEPLISRVCTVVGESLQTQQNIDVLIGTPIKHALRAQGFNEEQCARIIIGGPMMGYAVQDLAIPVVKTTNCILVPSHQEMPPPAPQQACIRCGACAEACPASLLPQQLFWYSQSEDLDRLRSHNLADCIECGACSFVCPSNIPLVQYYRASKGAIRQHDEEKRQSERSRQRFEFRKERIEKAEQEKEAKRQARKVAAEAAKRKLAEAESNSANHADTVKPASPAAQTKSNDVDPVKQRAKLERALSSAESRAERGQKQLATAIEEKAEEARIETLRARLKEAERKVKDAKTKLDTFSQNAVKSPSDATHIIEKKMALSGKEKLQATLNTLEKRLATAKEKYAEALASNLPTAQALASGVEKLTEKLTSAQNELEALQDASSPPDISSKEESAADMAIKKAQVRAASLANMSHDEKKRAQLESLKKRLNKAKIRLADAEKNDDENLEAFRGGVAKLEEKLAHAQNTAEDSL